MSTHHAEIRWECAGDFARGTYSRAHVWRFDGGAEVPASSSPSVVPLPYSEETAVDPEEAFVAAISSCHMLWFLDLARRKGHSVARYRDRAEGTMATDDGRSWISHVTLNIAVDFDGDAPDMSSQTALHEAAHHACFIANSVKTEIAFNLIPWE